MAGDWIKWQKGLLSKPEIVRMAGILKVDRKIVAASCLQLWEWADSNISEDIIPDDGAAVIEMSPCDDDNKIFIDTTVSLSGFADAMAGTGWLTLSGGKIEFPHFGRHNGKTAKTRARNGNNQRKCRDSDDSNVIDQSPRDGDKTVTREEKNSSTTTQAKNKGPKTPKVLFNFQTREWENLTSERIEYWQKSFPHLNIPGEIQGIGVWLDANKNKKPKNFERFLVNCFGKSKANGEPSSGAKPPATGQSKPTRLPSASEHRRQNGVCV